MKSVKKRGQVWWIRFDPSKGSEIQKTRPAIIVSNNEANIKLSRCQVVPFSSQIKKIYRSEVKISFDGKNVKAIADQLTTVSYERMQNLAGSISLTDLKKIEQKIALQLDLHLAEEE